MQIFPLHKECSNIPIICTTSCPLKYNSTNLCSGFVLCDSSICSTAFQVYINGNSKNDMTFTGLYSDGCVIRYVKILCCTALFKMYFIFFKGSWQLSLLMLPTPSV